jgi:hypothetical protein
VITAKNRWIEASLSDRLAEAAMPDRRVRVPGRRAR